VGWTVVIVGIAALPFLWLGEAIWAEAAGIGYVNTPVTRYAPATDGARIPLHEHNWHDWSALQMGFAAFVCLWMLGTVLSGVVPALRERRRVRRTWHERCAARVRDLERELGFGAYDEIGAIRDLRTAEADRWYHERERQPRSVARVPDPDLEAAPADEEPLTAEA